MKDIILAATAWQNWKRKRKMKEVLSCLTTEYFFHPQGKNHSGWKGYSVMYSIMFFLPLMDFTVLENTGNGKL